MSDSSAPATRGDLRLEIDLAAPPARVWRALTLDLGAWWPADCYAGGEEGGRAIVLEPVPGGHMKETWEGGGGLIWGTVVTVEPDRLLQVHGATFPNWGGPNIWFGTWTLREIDEGTELTFEESTVGKVGPGHLAEKQEGWGRLFEALRSYLAANPSR